MTSEEPLPLTLRLADVAVELQLGREYRIGSAAHCALRIGHGSIAPEHAVATLVDDSVRIALLPQTAPTPDGSLASLNHNGASVTQALLVAGDTLDIGAIEARVLRAVPPAAVAAEQTVRDRYGEPRFDELMAEQLRRAPWFMISIAMHALLLFALQLWLNRVPPEPDRPKIFTLSDTETVEEFEDEVAEVEVEVEEVAQEVAVTEVDGSTDFSAPESTPADGGTAEFETWSPSDYFAEVGRGVDPLEPAGGSGDILSSLGGNAGTGEFRKTVTSIRESGLDIVFVFDSTQSMDGVLGQTKQRISSMIDVLHALVPSARIGVVTYRDEGEREDYLTRQVPVDEDYYRVISFMQSVEADGGGDFPEAVLAGLEAAVKQRWRKAAKRMIVLIGDAPPHDEDERKLDRLIRRFAGTGNSVIHTIMTSRNATGIDRLCRETFEAIAERGRGSCIPLEDEAQILREVLSLAFGRAYRRSIDDVYGIVERRTLKISAGVRDLVRRADLNAIDGALDQKVVDDELIRALARSRDAKIAAHLLERLRQNRGSLSSRFAVSYALQKMLRLSSSPLDPEGSGSLDRDFAKVLETRIKAVL